MISMPDNLNLTSLSILVTDLHSILTPSPASANRARITAIREDSLHDAEALASIFNDGVIIDDGSVAGRLRAILEATESRVVPGLQTGIEFHDNGFRGDRNPGGQGFKDPHLSSNNQVGHFLTAVGLSFNPTKLTERFFFQSLRDWLGIPVSMTDNEAALRLVIGHELAPDPTMSGIAKASAPGAATGPAVGGIAGSVAGTIAGGAVGAGTVILNGFRTQFQQTTDDDLTAFRNALDALGS